MEINIDEIRLSLASHLDEIDTPDFSVTHKNKKRDIDRILNGYQVAYIPLYRGAYCKVMQDLGASPDQINQYEKKIFLFLA